VSVEHVVALLAASQLGTSLPESVQRRAQLLHPSFAAANRRIHSGVPDHHLKGDQLLSPSHREHLQFLASQEHFLSSDVFGEGVGRAYLFGRMSALLLTSLYRRSDYGVQGVHQYAE